VSAANPSLHPGKGTVDLIDVRLGSCRSRSVNEF
jgi:hypothetical protein